MAKTIVKLSLAAMPLLTLMPMAPAHAAEVKGAITCVTAVSTLVSTVSTTTGVSTTIGDTLCTGTGTGSL